MKPKRILALINAAAGGASANGRAELQASIEHAFSAHGIATEVMFVSGEDLGPSALRARRSAEHTAVIAVGGDGTVSAVADSLCGSNMPLGVIPLGTLNHFAKDLKIPLTVEEAAKVIAAGHTRLVDVGDLNGRHFINNSSIGIYPFLVLDRERRRQRHGMPKWFAMILATFRAIRQFPVRRLTIAEHGGASPCKSACVFIGNNDYALTGMAIGTRQDLNRGHLSVYVAKPRSPGRLAWMAWRAFFGGYDRELEKLWLTDVQVRSRSKKLMVALDGEVEFLRPPLNYKIRPSALRVFVPATAD